MGSSSESYRNSRELFSLEYTEDSHKNIPTISIRIFHSSYLNSAWVLIRILSANPSWNLIEVYTEFSSEVFKESLVTLPAYSSFQDCHKKPFRILTITLPYQDQDFHQVIYWVLNILVPGLSSIPFRIIIRNLAGISSDTKIFTKILPRFSSGFFQDSHQNIFLILSRNVARFSSESFYESHRSPSNIFYKPSRVFFSETFQDSHEDPSRELIRNLLPR